jgi:hypothetical protein
MNHILVCFAVLVPAYLVAAQSGHSAAIVLEVTDKLVGCAVGDVDPAHPGNEIVVTTGKGAVLVVRRDGSGWVHDVAYQAAGEMIQVAIGDALPEREGDEIVVVGMAKGSEDAGGHGAARVIWRKATEWQSAAVLETEALAHGVAAQNGDVWVAGYDRKVHLLRARRGTTEFERVAAAALPGNGKCVLVVPGGAAVACTDGSLVEARLSDGNLVTRVLDHRERGRARLGTDGTSILTADDDGALVLVGPTGAEVLYREALSLRGAVFADLDPSTPGLEAATTGYTGRVTILRRREGRFAPALLFADRAGFHHAAAGELDGQPGLELVVCGMAGRVLVFRFGPQAGT